MPISPRLQVRMFFGFFLIDLDEGSAADGAEGEVEGKEGDKKLLIKTDSDGNPIEGKKNYLSNDTKIKFPIIKSSF